MKQVCISCGNRRGSRYCPALGGYICSRCCGEKRLVTIACPSDCAHLQRNEAFQAEKGKQRFQDEWIQMSADISADTAAFTAVYAVLLAIRQAAWDVPGLTDADVSVGLTEVDQHLSPIAIIERSDSPCGEIMWRTIARLTADKNLTNDQLRDALARVRRVYDALSDPGVPRAFLRGLLGWLGTSNDREEGRPSLIITPDDIR